MQYGLQENLQELTAYILGKSVMPFIPYQEDGNWEKWLPQYENQTTKLGQETSGCTVWGSENQIETLCKYIYRLEPNYSERFIYNLVPVIPGRGADPQDTYECIRKNGLIDEAFLPMTDTLDEYLDKSQITGSLRAKGQKWLVQNEFQHEWVWEDGKRPANYMEVLRKALKTSPIGISVYAWEQQGDEYISREGNNHWVMLYKIDDEGYPWIFDSYDHSKKKLSKDHNIKRAKRIWVNRRTYSGAKYQLNLLKKIVNYLLQKTTLIDVVTQRLGTDVSPEDLAKDEVGCAESVTNLLKILYPETPIITGTYTLYDYLKKSDKWIRVTVPTPECVIICPTQEGKPFPGHVGIFMEDMTIASNDSATGRFLKNYTLDVWRERWVDRGDYQIFMFKHV